MPWKSEKQRKWMWQNKPELAREWAAKYNLGGEVEDLLKRGVKPEQIEMAFKRNGFNIGGAIASGFKRGFDMSPQLRNAVAARQAEWRNAGLAGGLQSLGKGADAASARAGAAGLRTNALGRWGSGGYQPANFSSKALPDTNFSGQAQPISQSLQEQGNAMVGAAGDVNAIQQRSQDRQWALEDESRKLQQAEAKAIANAEAQGKQVQSAKSETWKSSTDPEAPVIFSTALTYKDGSTELKVTDSAGNEIEGIPSGYTNEKGESPDQAGLAEFNKGEAKNASEYSSNMANVRSSANQIKREANIAIAILERYPVVAGVLNSPEGSGTLGRLPAALLQQLREGVSVIWGDISVDFTTLIETVALDTKQKRALEQLKAAFSKLGTIARQEIAGQGPITDREAEQVAQQFGSLNSPASTVIATLRLAVWRADLSIQQADEWNKFVTASKNNNQAPNVNQFLSNIWAPIAQSAIANINVNAFGEITTAEAEAGDIDPNLQALSDRIDSSIANRGVEHQASFSGANVNFYELDANLVPTEVRNELDEALRGADKSGVIYAKEFNRYWAVEDKLVGGFRYYVSRSVK